MSIRNIKNSSACKASLFIILFAIIGLYLSFDLRMGSLLEMGPGYFPVIIFIVLILLGCTQFLISYKKSSSFVACEENNIVWKPFYFIVSSLLCFWLLVESLGFVISSIFLILISTRAQSLIKFKKALFFSSVVSVIAAVLFIFLLNMPFPVWPIWIE